MSHHLTAFATYYRERMQAIRQTGCLQLTDEVVGFRDVIVFYHVLSYSDSTQLSKSASGQINWLVKAKKQNSYVVFFETPSLEALKQHFKVEIERLLGEMEYPAFVEWLKHSFEFERIVL